MTWQHVSHVEKPHFSVVPVTALSTVQRLHRETRGVAVNKSEGAGLQARGFTDGFRDSGGHHGSQLPPEQDARPWNQS